jgi:hypothetical protein
VSFKEAVTGIKMAIIQRRHPEEILDQSQTEIIQEKLLTAVDANPAVETPTISTFQICTGSTLDYLCK